MGQGSGSERMKQGKILKVFLRRKRGCLLSRSQRDLIQRRNKPDAGNIEFVQLLIVGDEQVYA
jgi:hypothetical protein